MKPARIVVVEDERILALHLQEQLTRLGYEVAAVASSGCAALDHIVRERPDLVLMDIHIEGELDGIETIAKLPGDVHAPVIYLTAYSEETTLERARATKPYGYLIKPYSERELHATIQMALERGRVEAALRSSEDRFRSIVGAISEGIFLVDGETGEFAEVNPPGCAMFGFRRDELIGQNLRSLSASPELLTGARTWVEQAVSSGQPRRLDWRCRRKDGEVFWAELSIQVATIDARPMVLAIVRDLTERRMIEEQLRQAQKIEAIGQLTGGIAHDFNNLLGVIIGNLDLLRETRTNDQELSELSGDALEAALRGADLTRRLLAFARRQPLQPQTLDLNELVDGTVRLLRRVLGENIEVRTGFEENTCRVRVDRNQLEAALTNLATNARDAMPGGGRLTISTGRRCLDTDYAERQPDVTPGHYAIIEVTDTGVGMLEEVRARIFEPFFTTKDTGKGTGLGLSMVFGFLKQSGGHVSVYSEAGLGTTFRLYLPLASGEVSMASDTQRVDHLIGKGETALVVEDDTPIRRIVVRYFRELGFDVIEAKNATEAISRLEAEKIEILFTDVVMPGAIDGVELARVAADRWPGLTVVLTSGFPQTRLDDGLTQARFRLLSKPYRKAELAQILREELRGARAEPVRGR
jgi:PAS domain S-box-containing protein